MSAYEDDLVFEHITDPIESVQDYVSGGLHPLHLGDSLDDGRYKILRKLGYGGYSTVWLAQDTSTDTFVALKVTRADSDQSKEIRIQNVLNAKAGQHPGSTHTMLLRNHFVTPGPNGNHNCLVYDALGPSIAHVRDELGALNTPYLTLAALRKIAYQVLLGLDYVHSVGVAHGDIYAANVLLVVEDLSQQSIEHLSQSRDEVSIDVQRIDGPRQPEDPRHLTLDRPLKQFVSPHAEIRLSDFGNSFFVDDPPSKLETPPEIRSPEIIVGDRASLAQDCWAFGCLLYNMLTNHYPFDLGYVQNEDSRNDAHLIQLSALLGSLPPTLISRWPRYNSYFDKNGELENFDVEDDDFSEDAFSDIGPENAPNKDCADVSSDTDKKEFDRDAEVSIDRDSLSRSESQDSGNSRPYPSIIKYTEQKAFVGKEYPTSLAEFHVMYPPLKQRLMSEKHPDIGPREFEMVLNLLQSIFVCEPEQRPRTKDLLQHAWIREYCTPSNESAGVTGQENAEPPKKRKRSEGDGRSLEDDKRDTD